MKQLQEPCKSAITEGRCLGCNQLENADFVSDKKCKYAKQQTAKESIEQIRLILGVE